MTLIIKRKEHREVYDEKKVYASVYRAAMSASYSEQKSEKLSEHVMRSVTAWITKLSRNQEVSSRDIRAQIILLLTDKDLRLLYAHHYDLC